MELLHGIGEISRYEPKADVTRPLDRAGYEAEGRFAGLPWRGRFSTGSRREGFWSRLARAPAGIGAEGGFAVRSAGDSCRIVHSEIHVLPLWLTPLLPAPAIYLRAAMRKEMRDLGVLRAGTLPGVRLVVNLRA